MKIFKVGQTVYYYLESDGIGRIVECVIKQVTKDLSTKKITYVVGSENDCGWLRLNDRALTSDCLYASKKQIMKEHAAEGGKIILQIFYNMDDAKFRQIAYEIARFHHEKYNGRGYPDGLVGEQIPLHARIMAIADVFDAVSQKRCYRDAMTLEDSFSIIEKGIGTDFDPHLAQIFLDNKDEVIKLMKQFQE